MVTLAGPWMNLLLAIVILGLARVGYMVHSPGIVEVCLNTSRLSLLLCFFNLLPIPPLDGSQVVRNLIGISHETYQQIARYGIFMLILVLQIRTVQETLDTWTTSSWLPWRAGWHAPGLTARAPRERPPGRGRPETDNILNHPTGAFGHCRIGNLDLFRASSFGFRIWQTGSRHNARTLLNCRRGLKSFPLTQILGILRMVFEPTPL